MTTTPVTGEFFTAASCPSGCEAFTTPNTQVPAFLQTFPDLMFNPPGTTSSTRSFADLILGPSGASTGSILAQGNGHVAGAGDIPGFSAVFPGSFVVALASATYPGITTPPVQPPPKPAHLPDRDSRAILRRTAPAHSPILSFRGLL